MMKLLHLLIFLALPSVSWAAQCRVKPAAAVIDSDTAWSTTVFGCTVVPLVTKEINGESTTNSALLTIPAGAGFPIHRHMGQDETLFITQGIGEATTWLPGMSAPETAAIKAGDYLHLPSGGIHIVKASAIEEVKMLVSVSPGPFTIETFEDWPDSLDVPVGEVHDILGYVDDCPPGQETAKDEL